MRSIRESVEMIGPSFRLQERLVNRFGTVPIAQDSNSAENAQQSERPELADALYRLARGCPRSFWKGKIPITDVMVYAK
jgi:hypothetical protein